jgi:hypothetical protein
MATSNNCTKNCGCTDTYTVTQPCPPSCAEVFNAQCIVYTGTDISCGTDIVIKRYDYLDTVITKLVDYICNFTDVMTSTITCQLPNDKTATTIVTPGTSFNDAIVAVSDYFCATVSDIYENLCPPVVSIQRIAGQDAVQAIATGGSGEFSWAWELSGSINGTHPMFTIVSTSGTPTTCNAVFETNDVSNYSPLEAPSQYTWIGLIKVTATDDNTGCSVTDTHLLINMSIVG